MKTEHEGHIKLGMKMGFEVKSWCSGTCYKWTSSSGITHERISCIPSFLRDVPIFTTSSLTELTMNPMTLYSRADEPSSDLHTQKPHDSVSPERNVASHYSACSVSVYCELTRLPYACQKLSHWHLTKNTIYWLNEPGCSNCTARRHFPTTFRELRLRVISDVTAIAKSPRAERSPNPSFYGQSVRYNMYIKYSTYGTHWSVQNDQYYLRQTGTVACNMSVCLCKRSRNAKVYRIVFWDALYNCVKSTQMRGCNYPR